MALYKRKFHGCLRTPSRTGPLRADSRIEEVGLEWVLLLDDDRMGTRALSRWLKHVFGVETRSAHTIHQADCWLSCMPAPMAIISDFDLETGETGAMAVKHFRTNGIIAPALVLTGAPVRARVALNQATLSEIPVLSKTDFHDPLQTWLQTQRGAWKRSA